MLIPETVTKMGANMFFECEELEQVVIPAKVKALDHSLFFRCSSLQKVVIQGMKTKIDYPIFDTENVATIYAPAGSLAETYAKENNIPFVAE